uniref:Reverse transcriptase domain-containing protein n=1 Tax=Plectus sambesii TaxID=2011161 RepID=A0A914X8P3_9BILA
MNAEKFENNLKWCAPLLKDSSGTPVVLFIDNAPCHSRYVDKKPMMAMKADDMQAWLTLHNIPFAALAMKKALFKTFIIPLSNTKCNIYAAEQIAKENGLLILRLLPYHCDMNWIELVLSWIKKVLRDQLRGDDRLKIVMSATSSTLKKLPQQDLHERPPWTLLYADNVMLASTDKANLQNQVQAWSDQLARFGLHLNVKKTKYMTTNVDEHGTITINGTNLPRTLAFRYLGSTISDDWRPLRQEDHRLAQIEIAPIAEKLRESQLRWYGHILQADDRTIVKTGFTLEVPGARLKGRPKQRWTNTLHNDLKIASLRPNKALNHDLKHQRARRADPVTMRDKR